MKMESAYVNYLVDEKIRLLKNELLVGRFNQVSPGKAMDSDQPVKLINAYLSPPACVPSGFRNLSLGVWKKSG